MDYININRTTKVAVYKQIAQSINNAIHNGRLKYNDKLPTEKEVCRTFSISQTVVKMAYESLIQDNKIKRIKGKGTYVTNRKTVQIPLHKIYYTDNELHKDETLYNQKVIMFDLINNDITANRMLKITDQQHCYVILRVIKEGLNPILLQKIYLPQSNYPNLTLEDLLNYRLIDLIEKHGKVIEHVQSTFSATNTTSDEALLLNIQNDDAIYFVRSTFLSNEQKPIAYIVNFFPGAFMEFEVIVHAI